MQVKRGLLFAVITVVSVAAVAGAVIVAGGGGSGGDDGGSAGPPAAASPTSPAGIAPGEPTPPPGDTPVSNRDTPVPPTKVPPGPTATQGATIRVLAPIDGAEIAVLESFPPKYLLKVKAGLPNGCARADGYEVTRTGNEIRVAVYNTLPAGNVACTQIYGNYDLNINLGSSFTSGAEYRVTVNDKVVTFRAQ